MSCSVASRRRYPRYNVDGVVGDFVVPTPVKVANLSLGGMAVETYRNLDLGRSYQIEIHHRRRPFSLLGSVVWCGLTHTRRTEEEDILPVYRAGIEFEALSDQRLRALWDFIRMNTRVDLEDSVQARYPIDRAKVTRVTSRYHCEVKRLSLSGMLVETDLLPELEDRYELQLRLRERLCETVGRIASLPQAGEVADREPARIGVEFCHLGHRDLAIIERFLSAARADH